MTQIQTNLRKIWDKTKKKRKITQVQAGKELGMTQGQFSQYLNGLVTVTPSTVIKLANFLEVSPVEIDPTIIEHLPNRKKIPVLFGTGDVTKKLTDVFYVSLNLDLFHIKADSVFTIGDVSFPKGTLFMCANTTHKNIDMSWPAKPIYCLLKAKSKKSLTLHRLDSIPPRLKITAKYTILGSFYLE